MALRDFKRKRNATDGQISEAKLLPPRPNLFGRGIKIDCKCCNDGGIY